MAAKRFGLNYTTPWGVDLTGVRSGFSTFLIHDSGLKRLTDQWHDSGVNSPFWRLYHNFTAGGFIRHHGVEHALTPGEVVLIPEDTTFDYFQRAPMVHLWIHFSLSRPMPDLPGGPLFVARDPLLQATLAELKKYHGEDPSELRDQGLYHLSASLVHLAMARLDVGLGYRKPEKLRELLEFIDRSVTEDLSNGTLAASVGMSVEKFIRWFREFTGRTPAAYVTQVRVRLACEALSMTEKTMDDIALELGFTNRNYFSRVFSAQIGCGPAEFRNRQKGFMGL